MNFLFLSLMLVFSLSCFALELEEVSENELTADEMEQIENLKASDCEDCPKLILQPSLGLAYGQMKGVQETTYTSPRTVHMPLLDLSVDAKYQTKNFTFGASVDVPLLVIIPAYSGVGLMVEKEFNFKKVKGLYIQGRYYRARQGVFFQTYESATGNHFALQKNMLGAEIGIRNHGHDGEFFQGGGVQDVSMFFLRSLDGQWTTVGIKANFGYKEKKLPKLFE